ncbi:MAG: ABC transporter substrate-binding protein [Meiothermus sp.]|nr:ABC transporter substrate-binding protein [Meiothermus sp.]
MKRWLQSLLAATLLGSSALAQGVMTGGFDVGPGGAPGVYNPLAATAGFTWLQKYFSPLVVYDVNFQRLQGELAESWAAANNGRQYIFVLRQGVKWHDGQPFTAADVKFTLDLIRNPDTGSIFQSRLAGITNVRAVSANRVILDLSTPNAGLLDTLTLVPMLPRHQLQNIAPRDIARSDWWRTNPVGTGPFKWGRLVPDQFVELVANPDYWRGRPKLDRLVNRYFREAGSAVLALRSGDIQFTYVTADEAAALRNDPNIQIIGGPSQVVNYMGFNLKDPRFQNPKVREAIVAAIDRKAILDSLFGGTANPTGCIYTNSRFVPKGLDGNTFNQARARQLLQEANWNSIKGQPIEFLTYYSDKLSADVMVAIQQMLADVGVEVRIRAVDVPTYNSTTAAGNFTLVYAGQGNGPDPDSPTILFDSTTAPPRGSNRWGFASQAVDQLINRGRAELSTARRNTIYQNLCSALAAELPIAPMWISQRFGAVSKRVGNFVWTPAPGGGRYYDAAEQWTIR